ncbi:MAG TPA: glycosyltransferase family 9 protein [Candidatus Ozemobacteraceae bacterium]|nr:glycosyltransferase family 9 protein [Candidatus Ozemobacteraceae bacterium]
MTTEILIRLTAMGDVLLAVPAARALARAGREVHWVLHRRWAALAPFLPAAHVHLLGGCRDLLLLAKQLRHLKPACTNDLQGKPLSVALSALLGTPIRRYGKRSLREQIRAARGEYPLRPADPEQVWLRYARAAGVEAKPEDARIELSEAGLLNAGAWLEREAGIGASFTLLHPAAAHAGKTIPQVGIDAILSALPRPVVLIGDSDGTITAGEGIVDLRGRTPLELLPFLMAHARALISTDSGPMHLGRAVGIPVAGLFFQTDPCLGFAPIPGPGIRVFSRELACKPCSLHGRRQPCPEGTWACRNFDWSELAAGLAEFVANPA